MTALRCCILCSVKSRKKGLRAFRSHGHSKRLVTKTKVTIYEVRGLRFEKKDQIPFSMIIWADCDCWNADLEEPCAHSSPGNKLYLSVIHLMPLYLQLERVLTHITEWKHLGNTRTAANFFFFFFCYFLHKRAAFLWSKQLCWRAKRGWITWQVIACLYNWHKG